MQNWRIPATDFIGDRLPDSGLKTGTNAERLAEPLRLTSVESWSLSSFHKQEQPRCDLCQAHMCVQTPN